MSKKRKLGKPPKPQEHDTRWATIAPMTRYLIYGVILLIVLIALGIIDQNHIMPDKGIVAEQLLIFDVSKAAEQYAQVAGLLAGFAVIVLFEVAQKIENAVKDENQRDTSSLLSIVFLGNLIAAILWSLVSGTKNQHLSLILTMFATLTFTLSIPLTIQALIFTLKIKPAILKTVFHASVLVSVIYWFFTAIDFSIIQSQMQEQPRDEVTLAAIFFATMLPIVFFVLAIISGSAIKVSEDNQIMQFLIAFDAYLIFSLGLMVMWCVLFGAYHGQLLKIPDADNQETFYLSPIVLIMMTLCWSVALGWSLLIVEKEFPDTNTP